MLQLRSPRGQRKVTMIVIPKGTRPIRHFSLSTVLVSIVGFLAGFLVFILVLLSINLARNNQSLAARVDAARQLEAVASQQAEEINRLQEVILIVDEQLQGLEGLEAQVRSMVGLPFANRNNLEAPSSLPEKPLSSEIQNLAILAAAGVNPAGLSDRLELEREQLKLLRNELQVHYSYLAALPSEWPVQGRITSGFGYRRSPFSINREFHDGLDIAAQYGTPVLASGPGTVVYSGYLSGYGRTVTIDHGYDLASRYSHLSASLVKPGQLVERGQPVGRAGSSGRSTGPHLHFSVLENGIPVDPTGYLGSREVNALAQQKNSA